MLLDRLINQQNVDLYVNNTMTADAVAAFGAFQCPRVPVGLWDQSAFWITDYRGFAESLLLMQGYRLAKLLSYPLSGAGFVKDLFTKKTLPEHEVDVNVAPGFDDRFEDFWEQLRQRNPHLLLAVRSRRALEWHFKYARRSNRLWILTVADGPRLAAYAILDRRDNLAFGLKRVRLVDFQSLDGSTALLSPILDFACGKCRSEGIHMLENVGRWMEEGEVIDRLTPHRRKLSSWTYFYRVSNPQLADKLRVTSAWAPSLFDGNASL